MAWRHYMDVTDSWRAIRDVTHGSSMDPNVALKYKDNSISFLYLDTAHAPGITAKELALWWPKLKKSGSMLCGDDYIAHRANMENTYEHDIHSFFR
eukprot:scaffold309128_cov36-Tisochrysis_lutea.AAC.1